MAIDYTKTLNLPATDFSMRANLPQREPLMLENGSRSIYMRLYSRKTLISLPLFCTTARPFRMETSIWAQQ